MTDLSLILTGHTIDFEEKLKKEFDQFTSLAGVKIEWISCESEEVLKHLIPRLELKQTTLLLAPDEMAASLVFNAYRYLGHPFILNVISNNFKNVATFMDEKQHFKLPNLLRYDSCALQWHLVSSNLFFELEDHGSRLLRLGELKQNLLSAEAIIRDANCILFDIDAVKKSEFPMKQSFHQSGLSSEESCQLLRYAGFSNKSECIAIGGYSSGTEPDNQSINVLAQMIYYNCEGIQNRKSEIENQNSDVTRYFIENDDFDHPFIFLKGNQSSRWWVSVKDTEVPEAYEIHKYYPCTQEDYELALQGEPSETLVRARLWFDQLVHMAKEK